MITANAVAPPRVVTTSIIGTGRMGRCHLQAAQSLGLRLIGICDRNRESLAAARDQCGIQESAHFTDCDRMFEDAGVADLVIIATTADSHRDSVVQAAEAGAKMILCEKPMATSLADCDAMLEACEKSGTRLAINHQMRFMDQYRLVKEGLESGRLGRLASMNVVAGCFGLAMNGSHYFEVFSYLADSPIREVTSWHEAKAISNPRGPQFFDQAGEVRVVAESGQRLNLECAADQGHGMTALYATRYGHIFVDELQGVFYATCRNPEHREQPVTRYAMPWERREISFPPADNIGPSRCVIAALIEGKNYPCGNSVRQVIATLVASYKSAENGNRSIRLDDLDDYYDRRFPWA